MKKTAYGNNKKSENQNSYEEKNKQNLEDNQKNDSQIKDVYFKASIIDV